MIAPGAIVARNIPVQAPIRTENTLQQDVQSEILSPLIVRSRYSVRMQNSKDQMESQDQFEPQLDGFPSDARHRHRQSHSRDSLEVLATQFAD